MTPQVRNRRGCAVTVAHTDGDHHYADHNQRNNCNDFNHREPELGLSKSFDGHRIKSEEKKRSSKNGNPCGEVREPKTHVTGDGNDVSNTCNHPTQPVGPSHDKPQGWAKEMPNDIGKSAVSIVRKEDLTHCTHEQEKRAANNQINQKNRGTSRCNGLSGAHKKTGANCATNSDELNMAVR